MCPWDWPGVHPVGAVVVMGWMEQRIHNYCGKNISAGHIEGISQLWATQLPTYLGIMGCSSWGVNHRSACTFDTVMQVLGRRLLGSNEWSEYGGTIVSLLLWSSGPGLVGNGKFPRWKRPLFFFSFQRLLSWWPSGDLSICHPVPHYLKLEEYSSLKTKIH